MHDPEGSLFCFRSCRRGELLVNEGTSVRYTLISLLGLNAYEAAGGRSGINVRACAAEAERRLKESGGLGDTGLYLWLVSKSEPGRTAAALREADPEGLWNRYAAAGRRETMEMAWFLTGLTLCARTLGKCPAGIRSLARSVFEALLGNYGGRGIFGHEGGTLRGWVRGRIGSFADQVYPIYALSLFGVLFRAEEAVRIAFEAATRICRLQGVLGQWWWHYDRRTGRVLSRYPVYAVHQDGMAPMALLAAGRAADADFGPQIRRGLEWIGGKNECGIDLADPDRGVIWRSLYRRKPYQYFETAASLAGYEGAGQPKDLSVLYECRPYHLGWLLYALSGAAEGGGA